MSEEKDLIVVNGKMGDISVSRPPEVVLSEAAKAAKALTQVLESKKKQVIFNGERYLEFEDWQMLGRFYGVTAKVKSTHFVSYGDIRGFEATAVALRADGMEISAADGSCFTDEEKWRTRPKYKIVYVLKDGTETEDDPPKNMIVWEQVRGKYLPKRKRIFVGEEQVPLFQLKSMAQTRACAKVLRNVLAWVVVLAGYRPTPAEELDGMAEVVDVAASSHEEASNGEEKISKSAELVKKIKEKMQQQKPAEKEKSITSAQMNKLHAMLNSLDIPKSKRKKYCAAILNLPEPKSSKDLTESEASKLLDILKQRRADLENKDVPEFENNHSGSENDILTPWDVEAMLEKAGYSKEQMLATIGMVLREPPRNSTEDYTESELRKVANWLKEKNA